MVQHPAIFTADTEQDAERQRQRFIELCMPPGEHEGWVLVTTEQEVGFWTKPEPANKGDETP